jgi:glucosamine--fructose-6-phosphate aminotransferase (isomerizing)
MPWHTVDLMEPCDAGDAIIALSAGGRSIEPVSALRQHSSLPSLAVTSEAGVPLAEAASASLIFRSGARSRRGVQGVDSGQATSARGPLSRAPAGHGAGRRAFTVPSQCG